MTTAGKILLIVFLLIIAFLIGAPYFAFGSIWASVGVFVFVYLYFGFLIWLIGEGDVSYWRVLILPITLLCDYIKDKRGTSEYH